MFRPLLRDCGAPNSLSEQFTTLFHLATQSPFRLSDFTQTSPIYDDLNYIDPLDAWIEQPNLK